MGSEDAYLEWVLPVVRDVTEVMIAELADLGFEGFEERDDRIIALIRESAFTDEVDLRFRAVVDRSGMTVTGPQRVEPRNWNAAWEASVTPVSVGPFFVHPPWHEPRRDRMAICIEPKMSFGTGHHQTTRLMLGMLPELVREGDRVMDAGTGTGVLAIAAILVGAARAVAFDTDPWSVRNARENAASNGVADRMDIQEGGIDSVPDEPVDVIVANINRNVLLDLIPSFRRRLSEGGRLALSGVYSGDRTAMLAALEDAGFRWVAEASEGEWWAVSAEVI